MSEKAKSHTKVFGQCGACNKIVRDAEVGSGSVAFVHYGCGGFVKKLALVKRDLYPPEKASPEIVDGESE